MIFEELHDRHKVIHCTTPEQIDAIIDYAKNKNLSVNEESVYDIANKHNNDLIIGFWDSHLVYSYYEKSQEKSYTIIPFEKTEVQLLPQEQIESTPVLSQEQKRNTLKLLLET